MRTIATLNLPCSTSGIWRFAPPCVPVPAHASALPPPPEAFGVLLHAPNARTPTAINESSLSRFVAMVPPPRPPAAREDSAHARDEPGRADARLAAVHPRWDDPGFPAPGGQAGSIAAAESLRGPFAPIRGC